MKTISKYITLLAAVAMLAVACSEDVLDISPSSQLNTEGALSRLQDAEVALAGVYSAMQSRWYLGRNFTVIPDVASDNVKVSPSNSGRFLSQYQYSNIPGDNDMLGVWQYAYDAINRANMIINNLELIEDATQDEKDAILGEALALRAMAHFDLVRFYAQPYNLDDAAIATGANGAGGHLGIPYMLESVISEPVRESVASNYTNIIADLTQAMTLLTAQPASPIYMSPLGAEALLARVSLYSENWDAAVTAATNVINSGAYSLVSNSNYAASWGSEGSSETIFELKYVLDDYLQTNALGYIYKESGYGDLVATQDLLDLIEPSDVRGSMYYTVADQLYINKYPGRDGTDGLDNIPILRLSEMYLIRAEAAWHEDDFEQAQTDINTIRQRANPSASDVIVTASALLDEILIERRLELAFEGHRLWDLTRNKLDIVREDHVLANGTTSYPNRLFCFPIPDDETDANPNMEQNPGYD